MADRTNMVGFSQRIRLEWMEATAGMMAQEYSWASIHPCLDEMLRQQVSVSGKAVRGNRQKIITILKRTWCAPPANARPLQGRALQWIQRLPENQHLPLHWGMVIAVYPFWGVVAAQVGRLLQLQTTVTAAQVQRRIREQYGDRETVARALRRILRSYHDWGVLVETGSRGVYQKAGAVSIDNAEYSAWLIEALLRASLQPAFMRRSINSSPFLFPFELDRWTARFEGEAPCLEMSADGAGEEWLRLAL